MPALVALVVAEAITTTMVIAAVTEVITLASVAYSAYMMSTMQKPAFESDATRRIQSVRSSVQPHRIIYGEVMTGGVLIFARSHGENNKNITLVVAFAGHECESIEEIWLNDKLSTDAIFYEHIPAQPAAGYYQTVTVWIPPTQGPQGNGYYQDQRVWVETKPAVPAYDRAISTIRRYRGTPDQLADQVLIDLPPNPTSIISKAPESGLNNLLVTRVADGKPFGAYTGQGMCVFNITVTAVAPTGDTIHWVQSKYQGDGTTLLEVASGTQVMTNLTHLVDGVVIVFGAHLNGPDYSYQTTGHSVGQTWEIRCFDGTPWTENHRLRGRCYAVVTLEDNATAFPNGLPNIRAKIKGVNTIYDPRTGTSSWSDNWALCIRDYLVKPYGLNCPDEDINDVATIAGANVCDEEITLASGGTEPRYRMNGSFTVDKTPTAIMNEMLATAYGAITWTQGQYRILPAIYREPDLSFHGLNDSVPGLTESDLRGSIKVRPAPSMKDKFNAVTGTYVSTDNWQQVDFPKVKNDTYKAQDGGEEITKDVQLAYVVSPSHAQRVAKIMLEKGRQGIMVDFPAKWSAFPLAVGDNVPVSVAHLGWVQKIFTVRDWKLNPEGGVDLQLQEDAAGCYDWNSGEETAIDLAQNTTLPEPGWMPIPTGLDVGEELYATNVPSIIKSRAVLTWDDIGAYQYEVQYLPPSNTIWTSLPLTPNTAATLDDVTPGAYSFRVRSMNIMGVMSGWSTLDYTVLGKMAPPSDVTGLSVDVARGQVRIVWDAAPDLDIAGYEIQLGTVWGDVTNTRLVSGYAGTSYAWTPTQTGTVSILVKAIDTSGIYSTNATRLDYAFVEPSAVGGVSQQVIDNNVMLYWEASTPGTYSVDVYEVRRGTDFATADVIGRVKGTFATVFEMQSGTYKYWIAPVDSVGVYGDEVGVYATVAQPPDFTLFDQRRLDPAWAGTKTNCVVQADGTLACLINLAETFQAHFTAHGWSTPQDQVTAGFPIFAQPGAATASYVETVDYGGNIPSTRVTLDVTRAVAAGTVTVTPTISVSSNGTSWTDFVGQYEVYATAFRYVRYRLDFATGDGGIMVVSAISTRLDMKQKTYEGTVACVAGDSGGTAVNISGRFVDVNSIQVSAQSTSPVTAIYDFTDTPNPTQFKVLLFNSSGARVSGTASFIVRGV